MSVKKAKQKRSQYTGEDKRIGRLSDETLGYYRRVSITMEEGFENDEEEDIFIENVAQQLASEILEVSQNQTASHIVEKLVCRCNPEQIQTLFQSLSKNWETASADRFASHVTQILISKSGCIMPGCKEEIRKELQGTIISLWQFLQSSIGAYMQHTYASHVLRTLIEVFGRVNVTDDIVRSQMSQQYKKNDKQETFKLDSSYEPSEENLQILTEFTKKIIKFPKLKDYMTNFLSNPVMQTLLLVLKQRNPELCQELQNTILPYSFEINGDSITGLAGDSVGSRLVEQIVTISSTEEYKNIFEEYIQGNMSCLAMHKTANFVLQKVISVCPTQDLFECIYKELHPLTEDLLAHNHIGVVIKLAEGAITHSTKQDKLLKVLMKAFNCYKPEERQIKVFPLFAALITYDVFYKLPDNEENADDNSSKSDDDEEEFEMPTLKEINLHGSILLQKLLKFGNPRLVVQSFLNLSAAELNLLACDPKGSHIVDAFLESKSIGEKSRDQLMKKFKGSYVNIACSKCGSRTLERLWTTAGIKQKTSIAEELVKSIDKIRSHNFGHFICRNFALELFAKKRKEWINLQNGNMKKKNLFKDLIPEGSQKRANNFGSQWNPSKKRTKFSDNKAQDNESQAGRGDFKIKDKSMLKLLQDIKPNPKRFKQNPKQFKHKQK